jgi:hypothetical protein
MKRNARKAFTALKKLGAPVYDRPSESAEFILGAELRTKDDTYFADYYREELREYRDETGKIQNPFGIRTDVNDILTENGLMAEWINGGMVGIYQM